MSAFRARLSRAVTLLPTARSHSRYAARPPLSQCWPTGARTVHAETGGKGSRFFALKGDTVELATAIFTPSLLVFTALSGWAALTIARERFVWLENAEEAVYQNHFAGNPAVNMTRGQLKKLLSAGRWMTCEADTTVITNRGKEQPLVLLLNGTATATSRRRQPGTFSEPSHGEPATRHRPNRLDGDDAGGRPRLPRRRRRAARARGRH